VPPKPVITVAIPLKNDDRQIAQTLPTAEAVPVLLVDGPINHKTANAAAVPYVKVDNPMPFVAPITVTNDVVPVANNNITNVKASTSFSMALHNVRDETAARRHSQGGCGCP
jgi:hypothetical protein